ncbi:hypothetical protein SCLCIDRAFT_743045 [Scleroderma citrinum Foug A]|uniref:BZIP domain-containing protein n=1 Tax=Scleroderma citrinum Foug A TaxID=1036808 RepID=A0A0C3D461_9AGAM|nr:hypothetical protein SCLCIDRAFT_743045 [Scleroderma citrinum Foug A]
MLQQPNQQPQQPAQPQQQQPSDTHTIPVMRLRDDPIPATSTPTPQPTQSLTQQQSAPPIATTSTPPHALVPPGMPHPPPHIYQYAPPEYTQPPQSQSEQQQDINGDQSSSKTGPGGRQLSQSKRAEQNRKAQRAFRERRDQHVKALESRSQLLDAALASADEANRRWEECRTLVDQLRIENAALRAALSQAQTQLGQMGQASALAQSSLPQQQPQQPQPQDSKEEKIETPTTKSDG